MSNAECHAAVTVVRVDVVTEPVEFQILLTERFALGQKKGHFFALDNQRID